MKQSVENIRTIINDKAFNEDLETLRTSCEIEIAEYTTIEFVDKMIFYFSQLNWAIDNGMMESIPVVKREQIHGNLSQIKTLTNQINDRRLSNQIQTLSTRFKTLEDLIFQCSFANEETEYDTPEEELEALRHQYNQIFSDFKTVHEKKLAIEQILSEVEEKSQNIQEVDKQTKHLEVEIESSKKNIEASNINISKDEQEIANRKKEIVAFHTTIVDHEKKLKTADENLDAKLTKATKLINQAEKALELKSAEGISAAYSSRLEKIRASKSKRWWIFASIVFVSISITLGLILTGLSVKGISWAGTDNIAVIIGRITITLIGISAAIFCIKRYTILRNLEEDYEYKIILTKSILAFSKHIEEIGEDKEQVKGFLNKVLNELIQDPMRVKDLGKEKDEKVGAFDLLSVIKNLSKNS